MSKITDFYIVNALFSELGWGNLSDGFATRDDAIECIEQATGTTLQFCVIHVDLENNTAHDVTDDILAQIAAKETDQ